MLFLLNDVVFHIDAAKTPPLEAMRFATLTLKDVARLGQELFAEDALVQHSRPVRAERLINLIIAKAPQINAALFVAPSHGCRPQEVSFRVAEVRFEVLSALWARQNQGALSAVEADRQVWQRMAA